MADNSWENCSPREQYTKPPVTIESLERLYPTTSIENHIGAIFDDFSEEIKDCINPCKRFNKGTFDIDYQDRLSQQLYLLRYLMVYAYENKEMYKDILCDISKHEERIKISSLGCGSAIDYWALEEVLKEYNCGFDFVEYCGVDTVKWDYSFGKDRPFCKKTITIMDAGGYLEEKESIDENILIFPRSISDFPDDSFNRICKSLEQKTIVNDTFYVMISGLFSKAKEIQARNCKRINAIDTALRNNSFVRTNELMYHYDNPKTGITTLDKSLRYPDGSVTSNSKINVKCEKWIDHLYCGECLFNKKVMLTCGNVNYRLMKFERK